LQRVSSNQFHSITYRLGADHTINYKKTPEYSKVVMDLTDRKGVDIILDPVGAQNYAQNLASIAMDARWVVYGSLGGLDVDCTEAGGKFSMRPLFAKRANLLFTTLRNRSDEFKTDLIKRFSDDCLPDFESGKLRPIVDRVFKMS
jgi:tumor protein p53-inducible protein 3